MHVMSEPDSELAVTVVVPTRDRPGLLARCADSVGAALREQDELIVVDSASADRSAVEAVRLPANGRLVRCSRPGVSRARNAGWRVAANPVVLFTDDDVVVAEGWRDALAAAVVAHPDAGFVTGRVLPSPGQVPSRDVAIKREEHPEVYDANSVGNLGHSANLGMRRAVLEQVGGFDESLGVGGRFKSSPETDLFDRCFAAGLLGRYEPAALAWHDQWRGPRRLLALEARYGYGNGARLAKLVRTDRPRARLVGRDALVGWGVKEIGHEIRLRHGYPAIGAFVRLLATGAGFARARVVPVTDGLFVPRADR